ncbi:transporter substrate-binding domain-containing protein [Glaciimonas sp. PCH181]|uniref:transporter substrate-binding domain-containing protein n=1 Tax=Glaciimonas sp. PCH181 TaxID=2133943 RepID=UPI000D3391B3|nr:transporter substrate-binding domain-containing protein [Glaciimonas sp. PCH181]PUA16609.1 ABC transporter substrate-binding protein [Glaciimonas sp. PCH181]
MKKQVAASVTFAACALILSGVTASAHADQLSDIKARGSLNCGTQNASEPYAFPDPTTRQIVGFDVDICNALAKGLGVKLQHKPLSTDARIPELKTRRVDVLAASVAYMPARAKQIDFSDQYFVAPIKILVRDSSPIKTIADLDGKKISASEGSSSAALGASKMPTSRLLTFHDISSGFLALQQGKVDGLIAGQLILSRFVREAAQKGGDQYRLLPGSLFEERMGAAINKNEPTLMTAINQILVDYEKSGALQTSFDKWLGAGSVYKMTRDYKVEPINPN